MKAGVCVPVHAPTRDGPSASLGCCFARHTGGSELSAVAARPWPWRGRRPISSEWGSFWFVPGLARRQGPLTWTWGSAAVRGLSSPSPWVFGNLPDTLLAPSLAPVAALGCSPCLIPTRGLLSLGCLLCCRFSCGVSVLTWEFP